MPSGFLSCCFGKQPQQRPVAHVNHAPNRMPNGAGNNLNQAVRSIPNANVIVAVPTPQAPVQITVRSNQFQPSQNYALDALLNFANQKQYAPENQLPLMGELAVHLHNTALNRETRKNIAKAITMGLPEGETVYLQDKQRDAEFFAAYAVDMIMVDYNPQTASFIQNCELADSVDRLLAHSGSRTQIKVNGINHPREYLQGWVRELRQPKTPNGTLDVNQLANGMNTLMKQNGSQTVHAQVVLTVGNLMYAELCRRNAKVHAITPQMSKAEIQKEIAGHVHQSAMMIALDRLVSDNCTNTSTGLETSLGHILGVVWTYIQNHPDQQLRVLLKESLYTRLFEIGDRGPCHTGCMERLLDVPNGVDLSLNAFVNTEQIRDDVARVAGDVQNNFSVLFAGTELGHEEYAALVNPEVLAELQADVFANTTMERIGKIQGVDPTLMAAEIEKMKVGFAA